MDATVIWKHGLSFTGIGGSSGFSVPLGAKPEDGDANDGLRPLELLLIGTAGCTGMDVVSILQKKRQAITAFEVRIHADRATQHPMVFTHVVMEYVITGHNVDPAAVERAIDLSVEKYCSAHAMLSKAVPIDHTHTIIEAASA